VSGLSRFVFGQTLVWSLAAAAAMLGSGAPVYGQSTDKSTEFAAIVSYVRETGTSDSKKFVYSFFAKALGLGSAEIPGVKRRGVSFGEDPRVYLFDILDRPSGTILLMYKYDPASGTIAWRLSPSGEVMSGAYIAGHPAKYKPGQPVTKFSEPKFHAEWVETKDGLLKAARYKPAQDEKEK
jgi:hypothetical protein